ncbi:hypothetical protein C8J56DRAFT_979447 [Mycena floridula]|nr:hypothetical protein C8J56DRAFT_979447 [Mycena floridula]
MSNDGRYLYNHNQGLPAQYDYPSYQQPSPAYESAPVSQRPIQTSRTSHSPSQQSAYNTPTSPYQSSYPPSSYMTQPQPQWTADNNWSSYNHQSFHPPPPPHSPFNSGPGRPAQVSPADSPRTFIPTTSSAEVSPPQRHNHTVTTPVSPPIQTKSKRRELVASPPVPAVPPSMMDFSKLLSSYKLILDANNAYHSGQGRQSAMDPATIESLLQAASAGAQMLESAAMLPRTVSEPPVIRAPSKVKEPEEAKDSSAPISSGSSAAKRQKVEDTVQEGQTCLGCNATSTPEWRRGPLGPRTLCNACGLVYAKLLKKRVREGLTPNGSGNRGHDPDDFGSDSDEDDEYDRRSD